MCDIDLLKTFVKPLICDMLQLLPGNVPCLLETAYSLREAVYILPFRFYLSNYQHRLYFLWDLKRNSGRCFQIVVSRDAIRSLINPGGVCVGFEPNCPLGRDRWRLVRTLKRANESQAGGLL